MLDRILRREPAPLRVSIYEHIRAHLPDQGPDLLAGGETLPDDGDIAGEIRWAPGARDGVSTHHSQHAGDTPAARELTALIRTSCAHGNRPHDIRRIEERMRSLSAIEVVDDVLRALPESPVPRASVHALGIELTTKSAHREAVKLGLALLGLAGGPLDREVLLTIGRHEEFTLYTAVAIARSIRPAEPALWELAQLVRGWGRIHLVEKLRGTEDPAIQAWIFHEGFRNSIMDEYLAGVAATTGGLVVRLRDPHPSDATLDAACDIVRTLIAGGPVEHMDRYEDGALAVDLLVGHLGRSAATLNHLVTATAIERFLDDEEADWTSRASVGWTAELRERLLRTCREIRGREEWPNVVGDGLASDDPKQTWLADIAARELGIETFDTYWRRLLVDPLGGEWSAALRLADESTIGQLVDLATRSLPLDAIATGPGDLLGLGKEFRPHQALDFIVQGLAPFPGRGWPLVMAALRSPVIRNRNIAIRTLRARGPEHRPTEARAAIERAAAEEPESAVRERLRDLLA
jgi:hypothetical protein